LTLAAALLTSLWVVPGAEDRIRPLILGSKTARLFLIVMLATLSGWGDGSQMTSERPIELSSQKPKRYGRYGRFF